MSSRPVTSVDIGDPEAEALRVPETDPPELAAAIQRGRDDAAAGRVTPHDQVKAWLQRWTSGEPGPAPRPGRPLAEVVWSDQALQDLEAIQHTIAADKPKAAGAFALTLSRPATACSISRAEGDPLRTPRAS